MRFEMKPKFYLSDEISYNNMKAEYASLNGKKCGKIDGINELRQLSRYTKNNFLNKDTFMDIHRNESNRMFQYSVRSFKTNNNRLFLNIIETYYNNPTLGGASFRVELHEYVNKDVHLRLCHVTDLFNGNYTVCCTPDGLNYTVSVFVMFTNFNAYSDAVSDNPLLKLIWEKNSVFNRNKTSISLKKKYRYCEKPIKISSNGHWMFREGEWIWTTDSGCILRLLNEAQISKCLSNLNTLTFAGSSHMRCNYDFTASFLPASSKPKGPIKKKHGSMHQLNVFYEKTLYLHDIPGFVKNMTRILRKNGPVSSKDIVTYQTGAHDIAFRRNSSNVFFKEVPDAIDFLKKVVKNPLFKKARKIFFTTMPFPQTAPKLSKRNNFILAALGASLVPNMRQLGFEIFDNYNVIVPRNEDSYNLAHFVGRGRYAVSVPGKNMLHLFLTHICYN